MNKAELDKIATAWVTAQQAKRGPEYEANWWAISEVIDWALDGDGDRLWEFILEVYKRDLSDNLVGGLAAGPLEDLLAKRGPFTF
ncbi:MAG TPA: hypothetical protein VJM50_05410 [Pyrinomonadaceae bacterium]|nr:hypothetical protein [Pyrinomonadaceae bacterium]